MLYLNFKRQRGRVAVLHQERCPRLRDFMFPGSKEPARGYWLHVINEETARRVACDLKAKEFQYPKCCERIRLGGDTQPNRDGHELEGFEIIPGGDAPELWLWDGRRANQTWQMEDQDLARLHGRIHEALNLDNHAPDMLGGISPPGRYR